jgi:hypothetical protein
MRQEQHMAVAEIVAEGEVKQLCSVHHLFRRWATDGLSSGFSNSTMSCARTFADTWTLQRRPGRLAAASATAIARSLLSERGMQACKARRDH